MWTPEQRDALRVLAHVYVREGLPERAVVILEALRDEGSASAAVRSRVPSHARSSDGKPPTALGSGTEPGARESAIAAAAPRADHAQVLGALAYAYLGAGRFDAALTTADAYLALAPAPADAASAWLLRSRAAWALGSSDEALHCFERYEQLAAMEDEP